MRVLLSFLLLLPLAAQEQAKKDAPAEAKKEAAAAPAPADDSDKWITGWADFGYRWVQSPHGSMDMYRSVVNLGEGPKLLGADITLRDPRKTLFDRVDLSMYNWGGDPYNTLRVFATKERWYKLNADYRNVAYFNNIPSFANPLMAAGSRYSQNGYDSLRRFGGFDVDILPGRRITPFFSFTRDSGKGNGVLPFITESNEYALPVNFDDYTNHYRAGVRVELSRFHVTLEGGGTSFGDGQSTAAAGKSLGNLAYPILGQTQSLTALNQLYKVNGSSLYTRVQGSGSVFSWLKVFGQFMYSRPKTDTKYSDNAVGTFLQLNTLRVLTGLRSTADTAAWQPHPSGNFGFEMRPFRRLRLVESFAIDNYRSSSSALLSLSTTGDSYQSPRWVRNYYRQELNGFFDVTSKLTVRGGFRYVWGDTEMPGAAFDPFRLIALGELNQKVGLAGVNYRWSQKLSFNGEFEGASGDRYYFRTALQDYRKMRLRGKYQVMPSLLFTASMSLVDNQNPGLNYELRQRADTFTLQWMPKDAKRFMVLGEYTRSTMLSDIGYLDPGYWLSPTRSRYRDNANIATGALDVNLFKMGDKMARINTGGSMFVSSGTRPTNYYQPFGRLTVPVCRHMDWFGEWRWYGFSETYYAIEAFRTNHFTLGFRFSL